jgi:hypothetical protein
VVNEQAVVIRGDEPIKEPTEDLLGRVRLAQTIASEMRGIDVSQGAVVGVLGSWGSGKTSLINLVRTELEKQPATPILDFNPWLFSGADQLIESFFEELAAQLRVKEGKLNAVADVMADYGEVVAPFRFVPVIGQLLDAFGGSSKALQNLANKRKGGLQEARKRLEEKLAEIDSPIVVVIDDIDRLRTNEIRDIFKLIRLTASFRNVLYLVAFDRVRVEQALGEDHLPGRDYLEKIIQVIYDIPAVPRVLLEQQIIQSINESLADIASPGPFDPERWPDVFVEIVLPLFRNMRDVRRYAASLRGTVRNLDGNVALVDVLALEAIRVFLPDLFSGIYRYRTALTAPKTNIFRGDLDDRIRGDEIKSLVATSMTPSDLVEVVIDRLFPSAIRYLRNQSYGTESQRTWLRDRRVAHPYVLNYYLEYVAGQDLQAFWKAEDAFELLTDGEQLEAYLRSLDPIEWEEVIRSLEMYEHEFPIEAALPATVVLLNLMVELPDKPRGLYELAPQFAVTRVVLRLLRRLPTPESRERVVRQALPAIRSLTARRTLLELVGHDENAGHALIDPEVSVELESKLRDEVLAAAPEALAEETELLRLLLWTKSGPGSDGRVITFELVSPLGCALLKSALGRERSQTLGTRFVRSNKVLAWEALVSAAGNEAVVREVIEACRDNTDDAILEEAVELADRYLRGDRPGRF